ncbi:MAG: tRNA 2-selenouridine(34) synthase MnmH [Bacteroidales bacterium]|nr:tRNA 2-selenouridine(34) synthase MnmH [Bacteroidales bacterium]
MSEGQLNIEDFLFRSRECPVIDVRSPGEFEHGHIPGAINLPLFSNEERSAVGTLYVNRGSKDAMMKGLEIVGPKMKEYAEFALRIAPRREALMHCWRGGMRSNSMAWLFNTTGVKTHTLTGGYKSYRTYVRNYLSTPLKLVVIGGMTGSGKTDVLEYLESQGEQIVHLERLARHKGSVFGGVGMPLQPTTEQFENDLFARIVELNPLKPVYVENESILIGRVFIPRPFFEQMSVAPLVNLCVPFNRRVLQLVNTYTQGDRQLLVEGVKRIERRLGMENTARAIELIENGNMTAAVEIVLKYYDRMYARTKKIQNLKVMEMKIEQESVREIAERVISINN